MAIRESVRPPVAKRVPKTIEMHGDARVDDYLWLREREDPEVTAYLEAENEYTAAVMGHTEEFQEALYQEMLGRIKQTDLSVPVRIDDYWYYSRTEEGKQYAIYCRKQGSLEADEQVLLDQNVRAEGHAYHQLGAYRVSPDHRLLAFSEDVNGDEVYTLRVKDLQTGELLPDEIPGTYYGVEWGNDCATLFYTVLNPAKRPYRLMRHVLGSPASDDAIAFEELDEAFYLHVSKTKTKRFIMVGLGSMTTSETHLLDADDPMGEFRVMEPRRHEIEYYATHQGDRFLIWTNEDARNFRLMEAPADDPRRERWSELLGHREDVKIEGVDAFRDHVVIIEREKGLIKLRVEHVPTATTHEVEMPEPVYTVFPVSNPEYETHVLRFQYTSLVTPSSVFDYDMQSRERTLLKQQEVLGGYDPSQYSSERIFATASDGVEIPVSLVYRNGMERTGDNPTFLSGYGSYGASNDPYFSSIRLSLLDRGFVYAIAHVRGGGELGKPWHDDGRMLHKRNTFTDFIACAEHLIAERYTSPGKLVINGGSAGGLLMGAVTNLRPDLFLGVVAEVPFVDVVNTILDPSLPLSVLEYEEWGDPSRKEHYDYMKSYSPYDNVEPKAYPNVLVTGGLNDPRVQYWEPAKWVAKLRALKTDDNILLLKMQMGAGHGGASGRYDHLREDAFKFAFVLDLFAIRE